MELVTLDTAAEYYGTTRLALQKLRWYDKKMGRCDRFFGNLVELNYKCPHRAKIEAAYFAALDHASGKELLMVRFVAKHLNTKRSRIKAIFRNFRFCNPAVAADIIEALNAFISAPKPPVQKRLFEI